MCSDKKHIDSDDELDKHAVMGLIKNCKMKTYSGIIERNESSKILIVVFDRCELSC